MFLFQLFFVINSKNVERFTEIDYRKKMILRAGVKNIREIQRFRPKRFINSEANPQVTHWETARALTLTERLEGMCSIYNFPKIRPFLTK